MVGEVLGRFRTQKENPLNAYLVSVNGDEVVQFQKLLDGRVKHLLSLSPEEIFEVKCIEPGPASH